MGTLKTLAACDGHVLLMPLALKTLRFRARQDGGVPPPPRFVMRRTLTMAFARSLSARFHCQPKPSARWRKNALCAGHARRRAHDERVCVGVAMPMQASSRSQVASV